MVRLAEGPAPQVLIVDDVATNREILAQILERIGVRVRQVGSGEEALAAVGQGRPDLVRRCREAAHFYQVTELREYLAEVEALGEGGRGLAQRLRQRVQAYDMEGVLALLKEAEQL